MRRSDLLCLVSPSKTIPHTDYQPPFRFSAKVNKLTVKLVPLKAVRLGRCKAGRRLSLRCFAHEEHLLRLLFPLTWIEISEGQSNK
jgi:hypothetical protein